MPLDAEIDELGPKSFTVPEVRAAAVEDWLEKFGDDANTSPEVPDGQIIDIHTLVQWVLLQNQVRLWADTYVRTARGAALDGVLDIFGKKRKAAAASVGTAIFYGSENTPVPLSTQVQTTGSGVIFVTTAAGSTGLLAGSATWVVRFPATIITSDPYTVDIDATPYTHVALGGQGPLDVATEVRDLINAGADGVATLAGKDASGRALLVVDQFAGAGVVTNGGTATDPQTAVELPVQAASTGPLAAPAGTLQVLPTPVAGILGVTNDADATLGRNVETDDEFRSRHFDSLFGAGCGTDQAIRARVLEAMDAQGIDFVVTCNVTSNRFFSPTDSEGRPFGSFETVVRYTDSAPADANFRVATAIGTCMPAGVQPYGLDFTESIETFPGNFVDISATIVTTLYLHLDITVTKGENFPTAGDQEQAIASAAATAWKQIAVEGQDWYRTGSEAAVSVAVGGTALTIAIDSDLTALPTDVPSFASVAFQAAAVREIIDLDASRVAVTIA